MPKPLDHTGEIFGRLHVTSRGPNNKHGKSQWHCLCRCGTMKLIAYDSLRTKRSNSCGCLNIECVRRRGSLHKQTYPVEYAIWAGIKSRCLNPNNASHPNYGGRGITVTWKTFEEFLDAMGPRPSNQHTVERLDNNGPYSSENCVWIPREAQARNTRKNRFLTYNGVTQCVAAWSRQIGIGQGTLFSRINNLGWSVERALTTPDTKTLLTFNGITQSIQDWADTLHIKRHAIDKRLRSGWSLEKTMTTPGQKIKEK